MHSLDAEKFIEVFVQLTCANETISYEDSYYDLIMSQLDKDQITRWKKYLGDKAACMSDEAFYDWYDNMNFDSIDKRDLVTYHLPESIITIAINNEEWFVHNVHKAVVDWYESINLTSKDFAIMEMAFNNSIIYFSYDILTGCNTEKSAKIKESFKDTILTLKACIKRFNELQGNRGVHVKFNVARSSDASTRAMYNNKGRLIKSQNCRNISISFEDLFYTYNKTSAEPNYIRKFFNIIVDERSKGMIIDHMAFDEFEKLTGKQPILV